MDIKELFEAAQVFATTKAMTPPGKHNISRSLRGKARIAKRKALRRSR